MHKEKDNGSSDNAIKNTEFNKIKELLEQYKTIEIIVLHSRKAMKAMESYIKKNDLQKELAGKYKSLSSPSNSNTHKTLEEKVEEWKFLKEYLK